MGTAKPQCVGNEFFATKAMLESRVRRVLHTTPLGATLSGDDLALMADLLRRHHAADEKIGSGIASIYVRGDSYGTRGFWIRRTDGSEADFSYKSCLSPKRPGADFVAACRRAIVPDVLRFRESSFANAEVVGGKLVVRCAFSGAWVAEDECHVDHAPPQTFATILARFVESKGIDPASVTVVSDPHTSPAKYLADDDLHNDWIEFHRAHATLRIVTARANTVDIPRGFREAKRATADAK